uniref:Transmembrane protein 198 n=1 Tax=Anopheles stephensi TaxID=30069 RepID=A0A182YJE3_ANOST
MNYVKQSSDWEDELLEALTITEQNLLLLRAGFDDEELRLKYFPRTSEISFLVHPMLKGLYNFCERLDDANASKLIVQLQETTGVSSLQNQNMETVLLHLLCNGKIQLGSKQSGQESNLLVLTAACKAIELYDESDFLKSIVSHFNRHTSKRDQEQSDASTKNIPETTDVASKHNPTGTIVATVETNHSPLIESYTFSAERAGIVLLINQFSFYRETNPELVELVPARPLKDRKGTEVDKNALESLFTEFGYDLILEENITHHQILQAVQHAVQRIKPIHCSLIVCLLSHGQEGKVFGSNSIPVEVKAIQQLMANERLTGKPKLLIVQACQGADLQSAVPIPNHEHDGPDGALAVVAGLFGAVLGSTHPISSTLIGASAGALVAGATIAACIATLPHYIFGENELFVSVVGGAIICAIVTLFCPKFMSIIASSIIGSAMILCSIDFFMHGLKTLEWIFNMTPDPTPPPCWGGVILCCWPISSVLGVLVQSFVTAWKIDHRRQLHHRRRRHYKGRSGSRSRETREEARQRKYRYLYQVRTARGDIISQNFVSALQKHVTTDSGPPSEVSTKLGSNDRNTARSDRTHLTNLPDSDFDKMDSSCEKR